MYDKPVVYRTLIAATLVTIGGFAVGMGFFLPDENGTALLAGGKDNVSQPTGQDADGGQAENNEQSTEDNEAGEAGEKGEAGENENEEADEGDENNQSGQVSNIPFTDTPKLVRRAFKNRSNNAEPSRVERIVNEGLTTFEIEYKKSGGIASVVLTDQGKLIEVESPVDINRLPKAVLAEFNKDHPNAEIKGAGAVQLFYYEIDAVVDGKAIEVGVFANGDIEDRLTAEDGEQDQAGDNEHEDKDNENGDNEEQDEEDDGD